MRGLRVFYSQNKITVSYLLLFPLLFLLSCVYACCLSLVRFSYKTGILKSYKSKAKIIGIGNITLGGSGKTPLVEYVAGLFVASGSSTAVLLRGYKRPMHRSSLGSDDYYSFGDEGSMLKSNLGNEVLIISGSNRARLAEQLDRGNGYKVIILDDGFQHWRLKRDLDIVAIDSINPFGNHLLLPSGPLREGIFSLRRAHVFCLTHCDEVSEEKVRRLETLLHKVNPQALIARAKHVPQYLCYLTTGARETLGVLRDAGVCLLSGIARPSSFVNTVKRLGARVVLEKHFPDHHAYTTGDMVNLALRCRKSGVNTVVTTQKDAQRLGGLKDCKSAEITILVLRVALKIISGEEALRERLHSLYSS